MENPVKMDDLGVPNFRNPPLCVFCQGDGWGLELGAPAPLSETATRAVAAKPESFWWNGSHKSIKQHNPTSTKETSPFEINLHWLFCMMCPWFSHVFPLLPSSPYLQGTTTAPQDGRALPKLRLDSQYHPFGSRREWLRRRSAAGSARTSRDPFVLWGKIQKRMDCMATKKKGSMPPIAWILCFFCVAYIDLSSIPGESYCSYCRILHEIVSSWISFVWLHPKESQCSDRNSHPPLNQMIHEKYLCIECRFKFFFECFTRLFIGDGFMIFLTCKKGICTNQDFQHSPWDIVFQLFWGIFV